MFRDRWAKGASIVLTVAIVALSCTPPVWTADALARTYLAGLVAYGVALVLIAWSPSATVRLVAMTAGAAWTLGTSLMVLAAGSSAATLAMPMAIFGAMAIVLSWRDRERLLRDREAAADVVAALDEEPASRG